MGQPNYELDDLEAQTGPFRPPALGRSATMNLPFVQTAQLPTLHEAPSPTGTYRSTDSDDSISLSELSELSGANLQAEARDGWKLVQFAKSSFQWLEPAGTATSLIGAGIKGAAPSYATTASIVQGVGGLMTAVGSSYSTYEDAVKAKERGIVDPERGIKKERVKAAEVGTHKSSIQVAAGLVSGAGGVVSAVAALANGRTDIAFAGTLISGAAAAVKSVNGKRDDPNATGKHFLIDHRAEITDLRNWNRTPDDVRKALTKFYERVDRKAAEKRAAAQEPQKGKESSRPQPQGRSSSVAYPPGFGYQQNPAGWTPGEISRRGSETGRGNGGPTR
ncbi:hypothetical protein [Micromonospora zhanjiangensis]|uniref:Uncharacterized protein n=1 Tax=Micromonospora zhanjiangensis TaxID=1522057 RepID=A0ABV8KTY3_9ACTN